ncbi:hypothetical protein GIB67_008313 [Kingdonia uniflora]|uniref:Malectin-like domain-containing protein n=1 Tax=Kingdonia uniflora TaxID=39325 RepID=A0A7J7N532_9MAGN|nr:hypothetical protein GIB67_008313 [Kingdonia uniflora]
METQIRNPKSPNFKISLIIFLQFVFFNLSIGSSFSPVDDYLLNCGSEINSVVENRNFIGDSSKLGSLHLASSRDSYSLIDQTPIQGISNLYRTVRVFSKPSNYEFEIKQKGFHVVRLHFHPFETSKFKSSDAVFSVSSNGFVLLSDYSQNGERLPVIKEFLIKVDGEKLVIMVVPSKKSSFGFINAVEVVSAPEDLVADTARFVNSEGFGNVDGLMKNVLETIFRVNVGGLKVTPFNDSFSRTWIPDDGFLLLDSASVSKAVHFSGRIKYRVGSASREVAPDSVYNTARVLYNVGVTRPDLNITWIFPVSSGYKYLVRMHFCDIDSMALNELYFNVYINGYMAYKDFDLSGFGNQLATPYYVDFIVDHDNLGFLNVSIGPSSPGSPNRANALLNGLEILKLNNSMGSLDGEICVDSILRSQHQGNGITSVFLPLVGAMCLLTAAFVFARSRKDDAVGWSLLPVDALQGVCCRLFLRRVLRESGYGPWIGWNEERLTLQVEVVSHEGMPVTRGQGLPYVGYGSGERQFHTFSPQFLRPVGSPKGTMSSTTRTPRVQRPGQIRPTTRLVSEYPPSSSRVIRRQLRTNL